MEQSAHQRFIALYETHRVSVYHMALSLLRNAAAAEDVMQDVFLAAYRAITQGEDVRSFRSWLLSVTRNRCLNVLRDGRFEVPEEVVSLPEERPLEDEVLGRLFSGDVLRCVSPEENLIFSLHCLDGYTYREIARGLDMPMGTVQTKCRAARRKLKAAVREL